MAVAGPRMRAILLDFAARRLTCCAQPWTRETRQSDRTMPNLPKPRLRRSGRRGDLVPADTQAEPRGPRVEQVDAAGLRWINIERPGAQERAWSEEHFDFHALDLEHVLSRNQRRKSDVYDDYLFIVLHFPVFDPAVGRLGTGELDLFVGPAYLVAIPHQPLTRAADAFAGCR